MKLSRWFRPATVAHAHCDLPCGVYDPAQARIEAELVKHHLWVLWTDYFKAAHFERYPNLHALFHEATRLAGGADGAKSSTDPAVAQRLLDRIDEISKIFWETMQEG